MFSHAKSSLTLLEFSIVSLLVTVKSMQFEFSNFSTQNLMLYRKCDFLIAGAHKGQCDSKCGCRGVLQSEQCHRVYCQCSQCPSVHKTFSADHIA